MKIVLIVVLIIFALIGLGITVLVMKARRLIKEKGVPLLAQGRIIGLEAGLEEIKARAAKPENAGNQEIAELQQRVEAAIALAKTALENKDYAAVARAADPLLNELLEHAKRIAEEERLRQETEAARQAANGDGNVIDGEFTEVKEPAALLPAPDAATDNTSAAADSAAATSASDPNDAAADTNAATDPAAQMGTEGDGTKK